MIVRNVYCTPALVRIVLVLLGAYGAVVSVACAQLLDLADKAVTQRDEARRVLATCKQQNGLIVEAALEVEQRRRACEGRTPASTEDAELEALRAVFLQPGTISLRDPETLAVRDDVKEAIEPQLTVLACEAFVDGSYSVTDWAVNIALAIDGLPAEVDVDER